MSSILEGRRVEGDLEISAEVVVVGSGAGGAVIAKELAEAGIEVVILEEGPYVPVSVYSKYRVTEALRHMGREAGTTPVLGLGDTPVITVMAGRALGGSSLMTGGVCFRIPEIIHQKWIAERGLSELTEKAMEAAFIDVERESYVETVPDSMRSLSSVRYAEGAEKMGYAMKPFRRNTHGCVGYARCNFGCPIGAKMSVDRTYLPKAFKAGARAYTDVLIERVVHEGGRVSGVEGRFLGEPSARGQSKRGRITVRAKTVVVACGTLHTPLLLLRSGLRTRALGRHLTLHPGFRVLARFEEPLFGWKGALQSVYSDAFEKDGMTLTGLFLPPNVMAASLPGVGRNFADRVGNLKHLALVGGIVHDEDNGRVRRGFGREPLITYRLARRDKETMIRGIHLLAETFFAAGAKEIYPPFFGMPTLTNMDQVRAQIGPHVPARRMECVTFHPLGTCRIAARAGDGVVDQWGRAFDLEGLWVADGSVFPTSIGVNSQLPIMAMAARIGWRLRDELRDRGVRGAAPQRTA